MPPFQTQRCAPQTFSTTIGRHARGFGASALIRKHGVEKPVQPLRAARFVASIAACFAWPASRMPCTNILAGGGGDDHAACLA